MTFHIENESGLNLDFDWQETARQVAEECLRQEKCPYETEISLLLTTNEEIRKINREYRNIDAPTDVLSFPLVDYGTPGDFSLVEERETEYFNPGSGELMLGDMILSVEKVLEQAENYAHSVRREFAFLITHSMFHLMGYDHMEPDEARRMEERQNDVLDVLNIRR